jgi:hypothetical protein
VEYAGELAAVPVGGGGEWGVALFVRLLPGEPEGGELFNDLVVLGPAARDLAGEGIAGADPVEP